MNKLVYILFLFLGFMAANEAPVWTGIPNQIIEEDCSNFCEDFPINLTEYVSDPDSLS